METGQVSYDVAHFAVPDQLGHLTYFTHEVDGRLYGGWFRRLPGRRLEVCTHTKVRVEFLESERIEAAACRILEELVRAEDLASGAPRRRK